MYVPITLVSCAIVAGVFASGYLQGGITGRLTPLTSAPAAAPQAAVNVQALALPTPELVRAGRQLFAVNCASCHGADGFGDGAQGRGLNPPVRNFHELEGWKNGPTVLGMWTTLENGIAGGSMAAYRLMPAEDRMSIIHYIRETWVPEKPEPTPEEIAQLPAGGGAVSQNPDDVLVLDVRENALPIDFTLTRLVAESASASVSETPLPGVPQALRDLPGARLFGDNCASCHGAAGEGQPAARVMGSYPFVRVATDSFKGSKAEWTGNRDSFRSILTMTAPGWNTHDFSTFTEEQISDLHEFSVQLSRQR
jgi:mono/diheme cytochrome c family protein